MKKPSSIVILTLLFVFLTSVISNAATVTLSVQSVPQQTQAWCWAASAEMLGKFATPSSTRTQQNAVINLYGYLNENGGATSSQELNAINYVAMSNKYSLLNYWLYQFNDMKSYINDGYPVGVMLEKTSGGAHFQVISGYNDTSII